MVYVVLLVHDGDFTFVVEFLLDGVDWLDELDAIACTTAPLQNTKPL